MKYKGITVENDFNKSFCKEIINAIIKNGSKDEEYFIYSKKRKQAVMTEYFDGELNINHVLPKIKITADRKIEKKKQISKEFIDYICTLTIEDPNDMN